MKQKIQMKNLIFNKEFVLIALLLIVQILSEVMHLPFSGELRRNIFWIDFRLLHLGLFPSIFIYNLLKTRCGKYLGLTLIIYCFIALIIEISGIIGYKDIVIELNSYWYSEFIFILISLTLSLSYELLKNGIYSRLRNKFYDILLLLQGGVESGKKNNRIK